MKERLHNFLYAADFLLGHIFELISMFREVSKDTSEEAVPYRLDRLPLGEWRTVSTNLSFPLHLRL